MNQYDYTDALDRNEQLKDELDELREKFNEYVAKNQKKIHDFEFAYDEGYREGFKQGELKGYKEGTLIASNYDNEGNLK